MDNDNLPLKDVVVLEFCQYLSGPSAALRLADLGATVVKVERPLSGDAGRKLAIKDLWVNDNSLLFHTINRNKQSFVANLKDSSDLQKVEKLLEKADVMIHNFRPGVMEKTGLGYEQVRQVNPAIIYAEISGFGPDGPWKDRPGQDLLIQAMAGIMYTTGNRDQPPVPFGVSISDILCGAQLVQGILAALIKRQKTGTGVKISVSLMESLLDFQFELLTTYFVSGQQPKRSRTNYGHPLLGAPYGVYKTNDGYIAVAMMNLQSLATAIRCEELRRFKDGDAFAERDEIKSIIAVHLEKESNQFWLEGLHAHQLWAMPVMNWQEMTTHEAYKTLQMEQLIDLGEDGSFLTTKCPIRFDGKPIRSSRPAPKLGSLNLTPT